MRPVALTPLPERIGPWRIGELLGQGGMATVYRATDPSDGREVAIKWLRVADNRMAARLRQEQRCMEAIRHPGVAKVYGIGEWEGRSYMVMECIHGTDLRVHAERLRRLPAVERHARVREIAASLCETLAVIHAQGMIHRDVKPANVLVEVGGATPREVADSLGMELEETKALFYDLLRRGLLACQEESTTFVLTPLARSLRNDEAFSAAAFAAALTGAGTKDQV